LGRRILCLGRRKVGNHVVRISRAMTSDQDIASIAGQLAELTQAVEALAARLINHEHLVEVQAERAEIQQERIELAARELAEVSARLQSAAEALRPPV
jgi:DNA-binding protein